MRLWPATKIVCLFIMCALASPAASDVITWDGDAGDDNWDTGQNWNTDTVPTAGDRAVIPNGFGSVFLNGKDVEADTIEIGTGVTLWIDLGGSLTLDNDDHNVHTCDPPSPTCPDRDDSIIDGEVVVDSVSSLILTTSTWHTFNGAGRIRGASGTVTIGTGVTMNNNLEDGVREILTFTGFGTFKNFTFVSTGSFATMSFACDIADVSGAEWNVGCTSILEFHIGSLSLAGDFTESGRGEFIFHDDVKTCGAFEWNCGHITLTGGAKFQYVDFFALGGCTNPGVAPGFPPTCSDPFTIGTSVVGLGCFE